MKIRSICVVVLGTLMLPNSAFALSCMPPNVVKTLEEAKASPKLYHILVGKFDSATPQPNLPGGLFKPQPAQIMPMWFEGYSLAKDARQDGYLTRFRVDIETNCVASWCSSVPSPQSEMIVFVEVREGQAPLLKISPCPNMTFQASEPHIHKIRQCLDKTCESELSNW